MVQLGPQSVTCWSGYSDAFLFNHFQQDKKITLVHETFVECSVLQFPLFFLALFSSSDSWYVDLACFVFFFNAPLILPVLQTG